MSQRSRSVAFLAVLVLLSASTGCEKKAEIPVIAVSGTVLLDGQPLAEGFLFFKTIETGNLERFDITDGEFKGTAQLGTRRVEIFSNQRTMVEIDGKDVEVQVNTIHPSCNVESTLTANVTAEGPNQFRFEVQRK